jgi:hypothetical protein
MGTWRYDLCELEGTVSGLQTLQADFETASQVQEAAGGAFGYSWLTGAVESFVDNWSHNRGQQIETLTTTREALVEIIQNYVDLDQAGVDQLNENCQ